MKRRVLLTAAPQAGWHAEHPPPLHTNSMPPSALCCLPLSQSVVRRGERTARQAGGGKNLTAEEAAKELKRVQAASRRLAKRLANVIVRRDRKSEHASPVDRGNINVHCFAGVMLCRDVCMCVKHVRVPNSRCAAVTPVSVLVTVALPNTTGICVCMCATGTGWPCCKRCCDCGCRGWHSVPWH